MTSSHGQLEVTPPTTPLQTSPSSTVLALTSIISRTTNSTKYATSIEDLELVVKELPQRQKVLALHEAYINTCYLSNLSSDVVPKFFGIFADEEEHYYLISEYAGEASTFEELSPLER